MQMATARTARTTAGRVIPSDAEDMLEPCVSITALWRWRGLDDTPDSSSAAAVDSHNDDDHDHNNREGEGHGRIVVGLSRRSRIYLVERLKRGKAALAVFLSAGGPQPSGEGEGRGGGRERQGQEGGSSMRGLEILLYLRDRIGRG